MNLRRLGERGFIEQIQRRFGDLAPPPPAGIGDDAAIIGPARGSNGRLLASTDSLIEGIHFRRDEPAYLLGRKSLAVNLSDIAAMGARPVSFLMTLGLPASLPSRFLEDFLDGLASSARDHGVRIVGGDTSGSPGPLIISITILGDAGGAPASRVLTRAGARPGDGIYVSGALGGSAAGRLALAAGWRPRMDRRRRALVGVAGPPGAIRGRDVRTRVLAALRLHLDPTPRLRLGRLLLEKKLASAAIDVSDGLSMDLARLADASGVGARLLAPAIPIADSARALGPLLVAEPLDLALHGGEDYGLLFTAPPSKESLLSSVEVLFIGRVVSRSRGLLLADARGRERRLRAGGYDHFSASRAIRVLMAVPSKSRLEDPDH